MTTPNTDIMLTAFNRALRVNLTSIALTLTDVIFCGPATDAKQAAGTLRSLGASPQTFDLSDDADADAEYQLNVTSEDIDIAIKALRS